MSNERRWTLRDLIVAVVVAAALGVIWVGWTWVYELASGPLKMIHPGLSYLVVGFWFSGGTLIPYLIRKPGASLGGELVAAAVQGLFSPWGFTSLIWGLVQGVASETVFLATGYKKWNWGVFVGAGAFAGLASWVLDFFYSNYAALEPLTWGVQLSAAVVSGALLGGLLIWAIGEGLKKAGVKISS